MARTFDNVDRHFGDQLIEPLKASHRFDAAVGRHLNLRGWALFDLVVRAKAAAQPSQRMMWI